ncbi:hypothetical protein ABZX40_17635 [Streptomyces sp. NPDC004610]|uniref:hypothetical protein n=1 Tax=unclassified Streptomyces TaxID=2593676 RepID=UPI0033B6E0C6
MVTLTGTPRPRVCGATTMMPVDLIAVMFASIHDSSAPGNVRLLLRCQLQEHTRGRHQDLVWELDDASEGEVWVQWADGEAPDAFRVVPDCDTLSGPTPKDEACTLYAGHPGCHSWQYTDPEQESIAHSPDFQRAVSTVLKAVVQRAPEPPGDGEATR